MKISFKNFKFGKGFLSISLDNGKSFQNVNVADIEKSGFLLNDDQDLSAVKIKGPSGLLKSLDVLSNVKIQDNDEIIFTYLKNIGKFDYVKIPESGFILDNIGGIPATTEGGEIFISDDESNSYYISKDIYYSLVYKYNELETHYKELMGKDNLKLELVFRDKITDESGNVTYEEKKRVSLRNKITIKEYDVSTWGDFCTVVKKLDDSYFNIVTIIEDGMKSISTKFPSILLNTKILVVPKSCNKISCISNSSSSLGGINLIPPNGIINIYYYGTLEEFMSNVELSSDKNVKIYDIHYNSMSIKNNSPS